VIFERCRMGELLGANWADNLLVLLDMSHVLTFTVSMNLLYVLIEVVLLSE
jgi:hypothetical protein